MVDLPQGWCECVLGNICRLDNGIKTANSNLPLLDARYLRGKKEPGYRNQGVVLNPDEYVILVDGENSGEVFSIQEKGIMGSTFKKLDISEKSSAKYALYFIKSHQILFRTNKKGAAIPHLDKHLFKSLRFLLPPLAEQKRIVEKIEELFSDIDEGVKNLKNAQHQVKRYRQSVLKSAFEGKLYKTTDWKEKQLKDVCAINPRTEITNINDDEMVSFLPMSSLKALTNTYSEESVLYKKVKKGYTRFQNKDILFAKITPCMENGKVCIVNDLNKGIGFGSTEFHILRSNQSILPNFLYFVIIQECFRKRAKQNMSGAVGQQRVPSEFLKSYLIFLPSISEQKKIVEEIERRFVVADELDKAISDGLINAEKLKQSILKKAFSGQLVPQNPDDEPASELLKRIKAEKDIQVKNMKGRK